MKVERCRPFGAIVDIDLSRELSQGGRGRLRDLLARDKILIFRDQDLGDEDHLRVMGYFGVVLPPEREHRELSLDGDFGRSRIAYHSDLIFTKAPYARISLHALDVVDDETSTRFVNGVLAAAALPAALRERLSSLEAVSVVPLVQTHRDIAFEPAAGFTSARYPVLHRHPGTGETILFVTEMQTARIEGLDQRESDALLSELFGILYAEERMFEHRWRKGDLIVWDNLALQHGRDDQSDATVRRLRRVIGAEHSFYELCPEFSQGDPDIDRWGKGERYNEVLDGRG